jgi:transglutaminase-like putative cysteine protease
MTKYISFSFIVIFLSFSTLNVSAQFSLPFGKVSVADLSNNPYKPDPGADAIVLSETGIASLQYQEGFYVEFERNVRIRIVNSEGYDYADIKIPFDIDDKMDAYKASTFNLRNGEKIETAIPKKSFIVEKTSESEYTLKFNFPDVHEGSVIEYSYKMRLFNSAIAMLVPWRFQYGIPVMNSSLTVVYPDAFVYKSLISGSSWDVHTDFSKSNAFFFGENVSVSINTWLATDVPAFREEPYILSENEHLTRVTFELARVDFPNITYSDISPTYPKLNEKLLNRWDFGIAMNTNFKSLAEQITNSTPDELSKLKKIHEYVSSKVLWNGIEDITANFALRNILSKEKGSSADINLIMIAMLRSAGLKADPVILSTRSHGSLNQNSAMMQQFNYVIAAVSAEGKTYLVDATDPLRPFNLLPFECLNKTGRLISINESGFVDLKNNKMIVDSNSYNITIDKEGHVTGNLKFKYSGYSAYDVRRMVRLEGEEGYLDLFRTFSPYAEISGFKIANLKDPDSDLILTSEFKVTDGAQIAGDKIIFNTLLSMVSDKNHFYSRERVFPVDIGSPVSQNYSFRIRIPEGYTISEKPSDISFTLGSGGGKFEYSCVVTGQDIDINQNFIITQTFFQLPEYPQLREFYEKMLRKDAELIILKKNPVIK